MKVLFFLLVITIIKNANVKDGINFWSDELKCTCLESIATKCRLYLRFSNSGISFSKSTNAARAVAPANGSRTH